MKLRNTLSSIAMMACMGVSAQQFILVDGIVLNNMGQNIPVTIETIQGTMPMINQTTLTDANGYFGDTLNLASSTGWIQVSFMDCDSMIQYASAQYTVTPLGGDVVTFTLDWCPNSIADCNGVIGGPDVPGAPCNDGDTTTVNDTWTASCSCVGSPVGGNVDCFGVLNGPAMPGTACIDTTFVGVFNGVWDANCICQTNQITDCLGVVNGPNMPGTSCDDGNPATMGDTWDANCNCVGQGGGSCQASFTVNEVVQGGTVIPWQITTTNMSNGVAPLAYNWYMPDGSTSMLAEPNYTFTTDGVYAICLTLSDGAGCSSTVCDTIVVDSAGYISNPNFWNDCLGVLWGPDITGAPCDDGNPITSNDTWDANCNCVGQGGGSFDCLGILNGNSWPGTACVDSVTNMTGVWDSTCVCITNTITDCLGIPNGPNLPWTPCNDGDPNTTGDIWNANCVCAGTTANLCNAQFAVTQAFDSLNNQPILNSLWVFANFNPVFGMSVLWDFGDGTTSTVPFPTHTYANSGPYLLCLTVSGQGCTDTYCDTIAVDLNGLIIPGQPGSGQGFTINVMGNVSQSVNDITSPVSDLSLFPNPVQGTLNVEFTGPHQSNITIDVVDLAGRTVTNEQFSASGGTNQFTLNTSQLDNGTYLLRLTSEGNVTSKLFVKNK